MRPRYRYLFFAAAFALVAAAAGTYLYRDIRKPQRCLRHFYRGGAAVSRGDYLGAIQEYRAALTINPRMHPARAALAGLHERMGDHAAAVRELEAGVRADSRSLEARHNLGYAQLTAGEYIDALHTYEASVRLEPRNALWHTMVARSYAGLGDAAGARREFTLVLEMEPDNHAARHGLDVLRTRP